ncbi:MAG: ferredoxin [Candidatus Shapirobacteria bacterium]
MSFKKIFLPLFLVFGTIFAFIISFGKADTEETKVEPAAKVGFNSSNQKNQDKSSLNPLNLQKLSVLPQRCIGCGKCVQIDPSHFELSSTTGKATIISSTNLNSQKLAIAINNCPVSAIVLE